MKKPLDVLLVEHDPISLLLESKFVSKADGFRLCGKASSLNGLEKTLASPEHHHDIAILNPFLPFDILPEAVHLLRLNERKSEIILVSPCSASSHIFSAFLMGAFDYILKPFTWARFRSSLLACGKYLRSIEPLPSRISQPDIDSLLERRGTFPSSPLLFQPQSKAPDNNKLVQILHVLAAAESPLPLDEVARRTSFSRTTTWRCLHYLSGTGFIDREQLYKGNGRPSLLFSLVYR